MIELLLLGLFGWSAIAVVVIILLFVIFMFNNLVSKRNRVKNAWAQIDVQLKRRYDLIPNLIETVKGYARYEKSVMLNVTKLRSSIMTGSPQAKLKANDQLSNALKSIFAVAENYPDLKASANFKDLQHQLEETEDKIAFVRTSYNDYVLDYNNTVQTFPGNVFAGIFGFKQDDWFEAPAAAQEPVKVDFGDLSDDSSSGKQNSTQAKPNKPSGK